MQLEAGKHISIKFGPWRFETTAYMVNKDYHFALSWGWRILSSWGSPFDLGFLRQRADANHLIQLSLSNPGTSSVAGSELFGHCKANKLKIKGWFINYA